MGMRKLAQDQFREKIETMLLENEKPESCDDKRSGDVSNVYDGLISIAGLPYMSIHGGYNGLGLPFSYYPYAAELIDNADVDSVISPEHSWVMSSLLSITPSIPVLRNLVLPEMAKGNCIGVLGNHKDSDSVRVISEEGEITEQSKVIRCRLSGSTLIGAQGDPSMKKTDQYFAYLVLAELPAEKRDANEKGLYLIYGNRVIDPNARETAVTFNNVTWRLRDDSSSEGDDYQYKVTFNNSVGYFIGRIKDLPEFGMIAQLGEAMRYLRGLSNMQTACRLVPAFRHLFTRHANPMVDGLLDLYQPLHPDALQLLHAETLIQRDRVYEAMKYLDIAAGAENKSERVEAWGNLAAICPLLGTRRTMKGINAPTLLADLTQKLAGVTDNITYDKEALDAMVGLVAGSRSLTFDKIVTPLLSKIIDIVNDPDEAYRLFGLIESVKGYYLPVHLDRAKAESATSASLVREAAKPILNLYYRLDTQQRAREMMRKALVNIDANEDIVYHKIVEQSMKTLLSSIKL